jgi:protein SCO1/2
VLRCGILALVAIAVAGCSESQALQSASAPSRYAGGEIVSPPVAPPLSLTNYDGTLVNLAQFRGKAVLLTFVYTRCPNVCPIIVSNLGTAQARLGSVASHLQIIAVTTDPAGDTAQAVASFLSARGMTGRMLYLLGSPAAVKIAWANWQVTAAPDTQDPRFINHSAEVFGVSASGKVVTIYPANFQPADIVHDVPLLANE